jgi:hypothetical protein
MSTNVPLWACFDGFYFWGLGHVSLEGCDWVGHAARVNEEKVASYIWVRGVKVLGRFLQILEFF